MALERVVGDDGFDIDSSLAIEAHQCAVSLLRFVSAEANAQPASKFAEKLISSLNSSCFSKSKSIRGVIPYQFTEVSHMTLSELDETWWVGSPSELM